MNKYRYSVGAEGSSDWFRAVADAQSSLERDLATSDWEQSADYFEAVPALKQNPRIMNFGFGTVYGVTVFVGGWLAKKVLDEVYDRTLKRPVSNFLDRLFAKPASPAGKPVEFQTIIYVEDVKAVVVIRALVEPANLEQIKALLPEAHRIASDFVQQNGVKAPIHCHKIQDGQVSIQPELFDSLIEMKRKDITIG